MPEKAERGELWLTGLQPAGMVRLANAIESVPTLADPQHLRFVCASGLVGRLWVRTADFLGQCGYRISRGDPGIVGAEQENVLTYNRVLPLVRLAEPSAVAPTHIRLDFAQLVTIACAHPDLKTWLQEAGTQYDPLEGADSDEVLVMRRPFASATSQYNRPYLFLQLVTGLAKVGFLPLAASGTSFFLYRESPGPQYESFTVVNPVAGHLYGKLRGSEAKVMTKHLGTKLSSLADGDRHICYDLGFRGTDKAVDHKLTLTMAALSELGYRPLASLPGGRSIC